MFRHIKRFKELQAGPRTADPAQGRRLWNLSRQLVAQARAASAPGYRVSGLTLVVIARATNRLAAS